MTHLAAQFFHLGPGEGIANILMPALLAMVALMLFGMFTRRNAPAAPAIQCTGVPPNGMNPVAPAAFAAPAALSGGASAQACLPGLGAEIFAREAKLNFIRLQAAFDAGNLLAPHQTGQRSWRLVYCRHPSAIML